MKRKIVCQRPGYWCAFDENGEFVNSIIKSPKGWKVSRGAGSHRIYSCLATAKTVVFDIPF